MNTQMDLIIIICDYYFLKNAKAFTFKIQPFINQNQPFTNQIKPFEIYH